jgi:hypothetical protein
MGTFTLVLIIVLVLLAIGLLFPFIFWVEFHAGKTGAEVKLFLFKRLLWTYEKVWKEEEPEDLPKEEEKVEAADEKTEPAAAPKPVVAEAPQAKPEIESKKESKEESKEESPSEPKAESKAEPQVKPKEEPEVEPKEEKKSLTEREFWTLLLTPDFDERGLSYAKKILSRFMTVFRVSFVDCYVEGIRMDYKSMGYGAAANAMMKGYPYLEDWDIRMDWTRDHELQAAGKVRASVNLCRTFWFLFVSSVRIGVMALIFWRRRAAVLKTGQLPELGYVRKKVLDWLVEE